MHQSQKTVIHVYKLLQFHSVFLLLYFICSQCFYSCILFACSYTLATTTYMYAYSYPKYCMHIDIQSIANIFRCIIHILQLINLYYMYSKTSSFNFLNISRLIFRLLWMYSHCHKYISSHCCLYQPHF